MERRDPVIDNTLGLTRRHVPTMGSISRLIRASVSKAQGCSLTWRNRPSSAGVSSSTDSLGKLAACREYGIHYKIFKRILTHPEPHRRSDHGQRRRPRPAAARPGVRPAGPAAR
jgi:hypothetical protein